MTKKFDKAKAEAIQKYNKVYMTIHAAAGEEAEECRICRDWATCDECLVKEYCRPRNDIRILLYELNLKVIERLDLLEALEEMPVVKSPDPDRITLI